MERSAAAEMAGGGHAPGKSATLCVWSGDPLDVRSRVEAAWIDGRQVLRPEAEGSAA